MKYLNKTFSISMSSKDYNKNYDSIFKKSWWQKIKEKVEKILVKLFLEEI